MPEVEERSTVGRVHRMPWGAAVLEEGGVQFRIFAPAAKHVLLRIDGEGEPLAMARTAAGWHERSVATAGHGTRYEFLLPDGTAVADPASRYQPDDVNGPSEVVDPRRYRWHDAAWHGRPWEEAVLYELHVGAFTPEGTFRSAMGKLDHLAGIGVTAIELMALADFPGTRNWGYDTIAMYAPAASYGRPEDLKVLIDAAHARGIMVLIDVVYNHFGPAGSTVSKYFPQMCSQRHKNEWGQAFNFDDTGSEQVREFIIHNALYWIEEFHADGLRLDATHAMIDDSAQHILDEIADRIHAEASGRMVHLVLEDEHNVSDKLQRAPDGAASHISAQWNHTAAVLRELASDPLCAGPEYAAKAGTNGDAASGDASARNMRARTRLIAQMAAEGYKGRKNDEDGCGVPPTAYVSFFQTHDLVGNNLKGDRIYGNISLSEARALSSVYLLTPQIPMLFMGDEWGASTPFPFFCDLPEDLAEAVRNGRRKFLADNLHISLEQAAAAPDPLAPETFRMAKLDWSEPLHGVHRDWMEWYTHILRTRREFLVPLLLGVRERCGEAHVLSPGAFRVTWRLKGGARYQMDANLCAHAAAGFGSPLGKPMWQEGSFDRNGSAGAWSVRFSRS